MSRRPYTVALTGGIASGKTSASNWFSSQGIEVIDADIIAREVVQKGSKALVEIEDHFGRDVITSEGHLDRKQLGIKIFSDDIEREWLNNLLHPLIYQRMMDQLTKAKSPYAILVIPLLVESEHDYQTDQVLVVDVRPEVQVQRLRERDEITEEEALQKITSQAAQNERLAIATDIIDNSGSIEELEEQLEPLHIKYLLSAKSMGNRS